MKVLVVIVLLGILGGATLYYRDKLKETGNNKPSPSIAGWTGSNPTPTPTSAPTPTPTATPDVSPSPTLNSTSIADLTPNNTNTFDYATKSNLPQSGPGLNLVLVGVLTSGSAISYRYLKIRNQYKKGLKGIQVL